MSELSLVDFLLARLDEDEEIALAATGDRVVLADYRPLFGGPDRTPNSLPGVLLRASRVLVEVESKRRIVDLHSGPVFGYPDKHLCVDSMIRDDLCETLGLLALPYADHPDYRAEEWAP